MRHQPLRIHCVAGEAATEVIVNAALAHLRHGEFDSLPQRIVAAALPGAPEQLHQSGLRKLPRAAADAALALADLLPQAHRALVDRSAWDGTPGQVITTLAEGTLSRPGRLSHHLPPSCHAYSNCSPHLTQ